MIYVDHGGLATAPGPLMCSDTTLFAFRLAADRHALQVECARVFHTPSGRAVLCEPLGSHVMLAFARLGKVVPETPPYHQMGFVEEREAVVFVPVVVRARRGPRGVPAPRRRVPGRLAELAHAHVVAYVALIVLDNPLSIAAGREVYGYPKCAGWPIFPAAERVHPDEDEEAARSPAPVDPADFALDVYAFRRYGDGSSPGRHRLLTLSRAGHASGDLGGARDVVRAGRRRAAPRPGRARLAAESLAPRFARGLPALTVTQLFLRQLRATGGGLGADFQQVVAAPATVTRWHGARRMGAYRLDLEPLASHPTPAALGIASGQTVTGVRMSFDFRVGPGRSLWRA